MSRRRKYRKNPGAALWLLLGVGAVGGFYLWSRAVMSRQAAANKVAYLNLPPEKQAAVRAMMTPFQKAAFGIPLDKP